jgi:hypothetical protein
LGFDLRIFLEWAVPDTGPNSSNSESGATGNPASRNYPDPRQGTREIFIQQIERTNATKGCQGHHIAQKPKITRAPMNAIRPKGKRI